MVEGKDGVCGWLIEGRSEKGAIKLHWFDNSAMLVLALVKRKLLIRGHDTTFIHRRYIK